jgi:hypothetical protein
MSIIVSLGEGEKKPRLQAKTLVFFPRIQESESILKISSDKTRYTGTGVSTIFAFFDGFQTF